MCTLICALGVVGCGNTSTTRPSGGTPTRPSGDTPTIRPSPNEDQVIREAYRILISNLDEATKLRLTWGSNNLSDKEVVLLAYLVCENWNSKEDSQALIATVNQRLGNVQSSASLIIAGAKSFCPQKHTAKLIGI